MGTLYKKSSFSTLAVFENGIVYDDSRRTKILGTYNNGSIYSGTGLYSRYIGSYSGGQIKELNGMESVVGYISGNNIYFGNNAFYNNTVSATFSGDPEGAAAATLILKMFSNESNNSAYESMSQVNNYSGEYSYLESSEESFIQKFFLFLLGIVFTCPVVILIPIVLIGMFWKDWKEFFIKLFMNIQNTILTNIQSFFNDSNIIMITVIVFFALIAYSYLKWLIFKDEKKKKQAILSKKCMLIIYVIFILCSIIVFAYRIKINLIVFNVLLILKLLIYFNILIIFGFILINCLFNIISYIKNK